MKEKLSNGILVVFVLFAVLAYVCPEEERSQDLDVSRFRDSAHHWYDINDVDKVINPLPDRPRYDVSEIEKIADNIILFQKDNGGWAKNFDMLAVLSDEQKEALINYKPVLNTTFDNGATHSQLSYLAQVYLITNEQKYKEAFLKGMDYLLEAQYDNGGWPQFCPDTTGYKKYITFNDYAMSGVLLLLQRIIQYDKETDLVDEELMSRIKTAYSRGIDCILKCQIIEDGVKTAWCQQHDNVTFKPRDARVFEKASIGNAESAEIVELLMNIENPDSAIIDAVECAVQWFKDSEIHNLRVESVDAPEERFLYHSSNQDRVVVEDSTAPPIWARFYELGTHRPLFAGRDGEVKYSMAEIDRDRRTGYGWYTYYPQVIYDHYSEWKEKVNIHG